MKNTETNKGENKMNTQNIKIELDGSLTGASNQQKKLVKLARHFKILARREQAKNTIPFWRSDGPADAYTRAYNLGVDKMGIEIMRRAVDGCVA
jgi:hypothetical protein